MDTRSQLIANGWKQGAVLDDAFAGSLYPNFNDGYVVVVSQDCDLVCGNFNTEPFFETLIFKKVKKLSKKFAGKDPRTYRGTLLVNGDEIICEALIASRKLHLRDLLLHNRSLDYSGLTSDSLRKIRYWMAKKYDRYGRPEMFDRALRPSKALDRIEELMEANEDCVDSLYLSIDPEGDLKDGEKYKLEMILLYDLNEEDEGGDNREIAKTATSVANEIFEILSEIEEISEEKLEVKAEATQQIYVSELSGYHYFDYDYLSDEIDQEAKTFPGI